MTIAGIPTAVREKCKAAGIGAKSSLLEVARQFDDDAMMAFVDSLGSGGVSREEVRKKARPTGAIKPAKKDDVPEDGTAEAELPVHPKPALSRFNYSSADNGFKIEIVFDHEGKYDRKEVLQALKEAFDHVKLNRQG
jgi:hypothetical protein